MSKDERAYWEQTAYDILINDTYFRDIPEEELIHDIRKLDNYSLLCLIESI